MNDTGESARNSKDQTGFFTVGPPLHAVREGYIQRAADNELYEIVTSGRDAYLFAPIRSGKTSMIAAVAERLRKTGFQVANLDLAQIGERDAGSDPGRWYYSIAYRLVRQLRIKVDLQTWWQDKSILTSRQRLFEFYVEVLLANTSKPIAIFVDELQAVDGLPFARHLVESIGSVNKARVTEPEFSRLTFVLSGECDPKEVAPDPELSPFGMMKPVRVRNFDREALRTFEAELNLDADSASRAVDRIFYWTDGQPYLTQKIARMLAREQADGPVEKLVDSIVQNQFGARAALGNEPHLAHINRRILGDRKLYEASLSIYGRVRKGIAVAFDPESRPQRALMTAGLVVPAPDGRLEVASRLYALAFTARWANENLPIHWRGPVAAVGVLMILLAIPFWYTQLLPKPYASALSSTEVSLDDARSAYLNLRSFPGHADTADRLYLNHLRTRAETAQSEGEILRIAGYSAEVSGEDDIGDEFVAGYWDREVSTALREEDRDAGLIAAIESLVVATPERRRRLGSLIGNDYPLLIGTAKADSPDELVFDTVNQVLTATRGADVQQWAVQAGRVEPRSNWTLTALEVTPLLRRIVVGQEGTVSRIGLNLNVSHGRLGDLRVRLIAPSGRVAEIAFDEPSSTTLDETRVRAELLAPLRGESLDGTWTLSIRDESPDVAGHLVGWELSLNSQVLVESFERGLDIPEPVEGASDNLWLSDDGRFAVARAEQSDSARLWNLAYASPTRTLAIPARERVLGISADASRVVTAIQNFIHVWNVGTGGRESSIDVGPVQSVQLVAGGQRVLTRRSSDEMTEFEIWVLESGQSAGSISIAGDAALAAVDRSGATLAVADYDRAIRIWDIESGELAARLDVRAQPAALDLSSGGRMLAIRYAAQGFSIWSTADPESPRLSRFGAENWQYAFSPSGDRFIAGSPEVGYRIFSSSDGRSIGPPMDAGIVSADAQVLAFSHDGNVIMTASRSGEARFWRHPTAAAATAADTPSGRWLWRDNDDLVAVLSPGGQRIAVGDADGHVHIFDVNDGPPSDEQELSFVGHRDAVDRLVFSPDGDRVASVGRDGSIRIWDGSSGLPRRMDASAPSETISAIRFSPGGRFLALLLGRRVWILNVGAGSVAADLDLGEMHTDIAFDANDDLYLASAESGLNRLSVDRLGNWALRSVWQGANGIQRIAIAPRRQAMLLVDTSNTAQVFDIAAGAIGTLRLELPGQVSDILFNSTETQVLLRTTRWVHRADITANGLRWRDAVLAPQAIAGSAMVFDGSGLPGRENRVLILTRDAGLAEVAELDFSHERGSLVFGSREELLPAWAAKLGLDAPVNP